MATTSDTRPSSGDGTRALPTAGPVSPTPGAGTRRPVPPGAARITGGWWADRQRANRERAIPGGRGHLEGSGNLHNLRVAAGTATGAVRGPVFADSDVHKWLEAAAWELGREHSEQLATDVREVVALVAAAQAEDGYLDSVVQERGGELEAGPDGAAGTSERYANLPWSHEHYCAGHLMQAAVALSRSTGDRSLLDVAVRLADHLDRTFGDGEGRSRDVDGHPVVEMALAELFRETGERRYLELARWFVEARGRGALEAHGHAPTYFSDRVPVRGATSVEGHAVRAVYLAAGATDVAVETGDAELLAALERQFAHMLATKSYLTGGLGLRWDGEAFGDPYELPSDRAYAETCAAIGGIQWAWRLLLATGDPGYADALERMLWNGYSAGVSLAGDEYFYVNPLHVRDGAAADHERTPAGGRQAWFGCACCPPNVMRTFSSLEGYLATSDDDGVQVHQYAAGTITAPTADGAVTLRVETEYPWDGRVVVHVDGAPAAGTTLSLRVPAWADGAGLDTGTGRRPVGAGAYAVARGLSEGDVVELHLPLAPRLTTPHPRVDDARGCVAVERGPLVYAVEQLDLAPGTVLDDVVVDPSAALVDVRRDDALGGAVVVRARGRLRAGEPAGATPGDAVDLLAVPYAVWANRGAGPMRVWLPTT